MTTTALGIDIGGTKIAAAIVTEHGTIEERRSISTPALQGGQAVLAATIALGHAVIDAAQARGYTIVAAGIGTAGQVDHTRGAITYASDNLPGWAGIEVAAACTAAFGLPSFVDNDVNTMALGEQRWGAGRSYEDALYITVGTGVGGALILGRKLRRGATWTAGEICHLMVDWDGTRLCSCGRPGHLEAYTSGPAISARYSERSNTAIHPPLAIVAERARAGDTMAREAIEEGARILGLGLSGFLAVLDPQALIIGGGVAQLGDLWWPTLEATLRAGPLPGPANIALRPAQLGVDAGLIGAGCLALETY